VASPSLRVTAVVCAFYPERFDNVDRIVGDILAGTAVPDTIIILNNNPEPKHANRFDAWKESGVRITSGWNTETRGKYVAALLAQADYYLLMDDDMSVSVRTLEYLLTRGAPGLVTANRGIIMKDDSFFNGHIVDADSIIEDARVDSICGSGVFISHRALAKTFLAEEGIRAKWPTAGDDILVGFANGGNVWVFPMKDDSSWVWLDTKGVALCDGDDYYELRDAFTRDVLAALS
jgi:hypothetical protein